MCNLKVVLLSALLGLLTLKCDCLPSKIRIGNYDLIILVNFS